MACTLLRSTGFAVLPEGCVRFPTMPCIGCMNGAGCSQVEVLSNTVRGALFSGGCEDGIILVAFSWCDHMQPTLRPAVLSNLLPSLSCKRSVHTQFSQITLKSLTHLFGLHLDNLSTILQIAVIKNYVCHICG